MPSKFKNKKHESHKINQIEEGQSLFFTNHDKSIKSSSRYANSAVPQPVIVNQAMSFLDNEKFTIELNNSLSSSSDSESIYLKQNHTLEYNGQDVEDDSFQNLPGKSIMGIQFSRF